VRTGLLYRSAALSRLQDGDAAAFVRLGIGAVYDLRTLSERLEQPDILPDGIRYVVADVIGDEGLGSPEQLRGIFGSPIDAQALLGEGRAVAMWTQHYRDFVALPSACAAYGKLFRDLGLAGHCPALFHCSTGKDRTGWASAVFLMLMGVSDIVVMEDYLASGRLLEPGITRLLEVYKAKGGDPELVRPILSVRPDYLQASLNEMTRLFGSAEGYFAVGLGVDLAHQRALREIFVER
jgi:protein-tyrosine phosphatase